MEPVTTYYKVVWERGTGQFFSSMVPMTSRYCLSYEIGQRTVPRIGGVLVFRTRNQAEWWRRPDLRCKILEGQGGPEIPLPPSRAPVYSSDRFSAAWDGEDLNCSWPPGTVAVSWFEPTKEVLQ